MPAFATQIAALLDHLGLDRAVVGGTSLGANVALEFGVAHADRAQGLFVEMPVLDNALVAVAIAFTPVLVGAQLGAPLLGVVAGLARRIPRSNYLVDIGLDWVRRDPRSSTRVLQGLLLGRTCPPRAERERIEAPALIIGHPSDPIHPFSDSDDLAREMPHGRLVDANSIIEWRLSPGRLNRELDRFLDEVWDGAASLRAAAA
jgi:pimeloyl-ACP methyl ester carboxylesterase